MASSVIKADGISTEVGSLHFYKSGRAVIVSGFITNITLNQTSYTSIGTLSSEYRPTTAQYIPCACGNSLAIFATMRIQPSGDVALLSAQSVSNQALAIGGAYYIA